MSDFQDVLNEHNTSLLFDVDDDRFNVKNPRTRVRDAKLSQAHKTPIRILHVLGGMNRGGVETWLRDILRHIDRDRFQMDFVVHTTKPCPYDDEIRAFNSQIIPCLHPSRPWIYASNFQHILRNYGPYDIVHSHVHHFSGYVLRLASYAGIPIRIAHTHTDTASLEKEARLYRRIYYDLMKLWINRFATVGLGTSSKAIAELFGSSSENDLRWHVIHYGIDLNPFQKTIDTSLFAEFGIPSDAFVIGHVGRFVHAKNHTFILDIAIEVLKREPKTYLLLVGEGELLPDIQQKAIDLGLSDRVIFTKNRSDVPQLMRSVMDVLLFPSLYEGLGNARLEAQSAGLPCIISDVLPEEGDAIKPLVKRLSLSLPASEWAERLLAHRSVVSAISPLDAFKIMANSHFNIQVSVRQLEKLYLSQIQNLYDVVNTLY